MKIASKRKIQIFITIAAVSTATIHVLFPALTIDAITVTLLIVAVIPWLEPLLKSVELPGGVKVEFHDLEKISDKAIEAGLIKEEDINNIEETLVETYPFMEIASVNQGLALVGLRIEIEKRLRRLADRYGLEERNPSMTKLMRNLADNKIISLKEMSALRDMIGTLNHAAHGVEYDPRNAEWVISNGPVILESLDSKLEDRGGRFSIGRSDEKEHWIDISYNMREPQTTADMRENISEHTVLWEKELDNIYNALLKKLVAPQLDRLIEAQEHWNEQIRLEREFIYSFNDLRQTVGSGGLVAIASSFMRKVRERTLELDEVLRLFADK